MVETSVNVDERLARFAPTTIEFDTSDLSFRQRRLLMKLIEACKYVDEIFWRQTAHDSLAWRKKLEASSHPQDKKLLRYLKIHYGPYDRVDEGRPFLGERSKPAGAAFYPEDLTKEELEKYLAEHPEEREALESPYTLVRRDGDKLIAVPYHEAFRELVEPAARCLEEAATLAESESLKKYLRSKAQGLRDDHYFESDCDWIDLDDPTFDLVIGPYEVYEDKLMGLKASYEGVVMIKDEEASNQLSVYLEHLGELEKNLPIPDRFKQLSRPLTSPVSVVLDVFRAGDIRASYQAVAFVLPNDPKVREAKGSKKVLHRNFLDARVNQVILPIAKELIEEDQIKFVTLEGYFNFVLMHELSHTLGPNYVVEDDRKTPINNLLKEHYSGIEEGKADVVGLHSLNYFIDRKVIDPTREAEHYISYLAGLFRTIRFGTEEAHGRASLFEIAFFEDEGAVVYNPTTGRFSVNLSGFRQAVEKLANVFLMIEAEGNYAKATELLIERGKISSHVESALHKLKHIPIDVEPIFIVS